jgi:phosphosulfolactate synthase
VDDEVRKASAPPQTETPMRQAGALDLPERTKKPRRCGLTAITDVGVTTAEQRAFLDDYHEYVDVAKLGIGTAYFAPNLPAKVRLYKEHGVVPYVGGTLFEKHYQQNKLDAFLRFLESYGIGWIEVSTGSVDIPLKSRARLIERLSRDFVVLAEVGYKDPWRRFPTSEWINEIEALLRAGSRYVILEGRDSATSGIYDQGGRPRSDLLEEILRSVDPRFTIFEAPTPGGRAYCINHVGANVNLGNVSPRDLLVLECERTGLRFDTINVEDR